MTDDLDELYAAGLDEFVARRNALAKRLRAEGDAERAAEVAALRKPTVAVWAVNRLARDEPKRTAALLEAADSMRAALAAGDTAAFERARAAHRDAVADLRGRAARLLEAERGGATEQTLDRLARTLAAASVDEHAERLRAGRLEEEVEAAGFGPLAGLPAASTAATRGPDLAALRRAVREAKARERETASDAAAAEREAAQARRRADELEREAARAREAADEAAAAHEEAEERLREAGT